MDSRRKYKSCLRRSISKHAKVIFISWAAKDNFPAVKLDRTSTVSRMLKILLQTYVSKATGWIQRHYACWQSFWKSTDQTLPRQPVQIWISQYFKKKKKCPLKISYLKSNYILVIAFINVQNFFLTWLLIWTKIFIL